jgi:ribosome maturation factor RimP
MSPVEREVTIEAVQRAIEHLLEAEDMSLVDLQWSRRGRRWVLALFIEKEGGITLDDCAYMSRQVGERIEVDNLIGHAYTLEVSSPGLDRPLRTLADYERFQEHLVRITTTIPIQGRSTIVGRLKSVEGQTVLVEAKRTGMVSIPFGQIKYARLEVEF